MNIPLRLPVRRTLFTAAACLLATAGILRAQASDPFAKFSNVAKKPGSSASSVPAGGRIPIILDTDINGDADDTWALVMVLKNPRFDVKLVTTTSFNAEERARLAAKLLTIAGRTDIPIGLGDPKVTFPKGGSQSAWLGNYKLSDYKGKIYKDGVKAMIDTVNNSPVPVTIISVGPLQTLGEAVKRAPGMAPKANVSLMNGNINARRDKTTGQIIPEGNTRNAIPEAQRVYAAPWRSIVIAPLDTAGWGLETRYKEVCDAGARDPLIKALRECMVAYLTVSHPEKSGEALLGFQPDGKANVGHAFFDCQAVELADPDPKARRFVNLEKLKVKVTDDGNTVVSPDGNEILVSVSWKDTKAYADYLAETFLSPTVKP